MSPKAPVVERWGEGMIKCEKDPGALNKKWKSEKENSTHDENHSLGRTSLTCPPENESAAAWFVPNKVVKSYQDSHLPYKALAQSELVRGDQG